MALSGNLEDVSVVDVLQFVHLGRRSGTLELSAGDERAAIGLHRGRILSATGPGSQRLGDLLLSAGAIDEAQLAAAVSAQERDVPRRPLGQILVDAGALDLDRMYRAVVDQVIRTVYSLVGWHRGSFRFVADEIEPMDDLPLAPGEVLPQVTVDTQMVLLEAARIFDEAKRDREAEETAAPARIERPRQTEARTARSSSESREPVSTAVGRSQPAPPRARLPRSRAPGAGPDQPHPRPVSPRHAPLRVQVVTRDGALVDRLAQDLSPDSAAVTLVARRDAGFPAPGEGPPIVLVDLRCQGAETIAKIRHARPHVPILAVGEPGGAAAAYDAGAISLVPAEVPFLAGAVRNLARVRRDLPAGIHPQQGVAKLRRIFGDLRSGLMSATLSLHLMSIIADSVERGVLFMVRPDSLLALGAFGASQDGSSLAERARGMRVPLEQSGAFAKCMADGRARSLTYENTSLPEELRAMLGRPRTGQVVLFPVLGGRRVISMIYTDNGRSSRAIEEIELLELATAQVGIAFENELLRRQLARRDPARAGGGR